MAAKKVYLAVDLGASSGRLLAGLFDGSRLQLKEVHRFSNGGVKVGKRLHWNLLGQWANIIDGLRAAAVECSEIQSVGVDTWGVDFGLLDGDGELLGNPYHYRDQRTDGMMEAALEIADRDYIFDRTGLQFLSFNTLFQLFAMRGTKKLACAKRFLMMPDLFHWLLSGEQVNEFTNATTTQMLDPRTGNWSLDLLDRLELPNDIFGSITTPGTVIGSVAPHVAQETGLSDVQVVLPGTHDTASAVMAVPTTESLTDKPRWCYISSGTWSLMGIEVPQPIINDMCKDLNFTNEGGVGGSIRFLKNIAGLWLIQECRRVWNLQGRDYSWDQLVELANEAAPFVSLVDPDDPSFMAPDDMPKAIADLCRRTGQPVPQDDGAVIRCALESLALRYRQVFHWLEQLSGQKMDTIHIVGGGTQNTLLSQMTADACGARVIAGPVEATAIGNVLMQAVAAGDVSDISQARSVVRASFELEEFVPKNESDWSDAAVRWEAMLQSQS